MERCSNITVTVCVYKLNNYIAFFYHYLKISNLFKFILFSTRRYMHYKWVNWCSCTMLPWKKVVLIFLHQKWLGLAVMGKYHSKRLMLFNLAFLTKCKYKADTSSRIIQHFHWTYIHHTDSNHSLGQRWHFVCSFVGPTLANDVGAMSFCSSDRLSLPTVGSMLDQCP